MKKKILLFVLLFGVISCWNINAQTQIGLDIDGEATGDQSGRSVSLSADGSTVAIGAPLDGSGNNPGHVRVYTFSGDAWVQQGADIDGEAGGNLSGFSVSLSADGNTVAIGAPGNDGIFDTAGHVRVYTFSGGAWVQQGADIDGEAAQDSSGVSVSLSADGSTVAIGAIGNDDTGNNAGHVRVYTFIGGAWVQQGADIDGEAAGDFSGRSVSLSADGNTVAIGAPGNDGIFDTAGHVRVYTFSGGAWVQQGADIDGEAAQDFSGISVSLSADGNTVAIGTQENDGTGNNAGHVRVYTFSGGAWVQQGADIDGEAANDFSGVSVSLSADGNTVAIGAIGNDGTATSAGHVRVYSFSGGSWVQQGADIDGEAAGDVSGVSVSLSADGNTVAIGAIGNDGTGNNAGHVRVFDFVCPLSITCPDNLTVSNSPGICGALASGVTLGAATTNGCSGETISNDAPTVFPLGDTTVTWTVTDTNGSTSCASQLVTVTDNEAPTASCVNLIAFALNQAGQLIIPQFVIDNFINTGSSDNCPGDLAFTLSQTMFDCSNIGTNNVSLTVTDTAGNTSSCNTVIQVLDITPPATVCQDLTVQLDATGNVTIVAEDIDGGSNDACGIVSLAIDEDTFDCSNIGANTVTLTVTDVNGNSSTCTATVTVEDTIAPIAIAQDITVQLDASGNASILGSDIDNGSNDACGITSLAVSPSTFTCSDVGLNDVVLIVTDNNGNTAIDIANVTVEDNVAPTAICQDITVQLDTNGDASIVAADVDGGSSDNCGIASLSIDVDTFDCSDVGTNNVVLTVTDVNGNMSSCTAVVTVEDNVAPMIFCPADIVANTNNGACGATVFYTLPAVSDNCGIDEIIQNSGIASGEVFPIGLTTNQFTVIDVNGNIATCFFTVTVVDVTAPMAVCQDITVMLDAAGTATITPADVDGGSTDNCAIDTLSIDIDTFTCAGLGDSIVTLTVTDTAGLTSTCTAIVTVQNGVMPNAVCQDATVQLDALGMVTITDASIFDGGSTDACGGTNLTFSVSPDTFGCADVGDNTVTITVTDDGGNTSTCTATLTVEDVIDPTVSCMDMTVSLDENGMATIDPADLVLLSDDVCGVTTVSADIVDFDCDDVGTPVSVVVTVADASGNTATCTAIVTVLDELGPQFISGTLPVDEMRQADVNGEYILEDFTTDVTVTDNCSLADLPIILDQDPAIGTVLTVGVYDIMLSAEDDLGNISDYVFELTVTEFLNISENNLDISSVTMYPNPASDFVILSNPKNIPLTDVSIYDIAGRLIKTLDAKLVTNEMRIDISELASATYMFIINTEGGQITHQIIKE